MREKLAFVLMVKILELLKDSGATQIEARGALRAADAMLAEADLPIKPTTVIETGWGSPSSEK